MFSEAEFTHNVNELLDLAHEVASETDCRYWGYYLNPEGSSGTRYHFFEMGVSPSSEGGVIYFAKIYSEQDCSCCPTPIFAMGQGKSVREALDNLRVDILGNMPAHTVGDEWKPTLGDLMAN